MAMQAACRGGIDCRFGAGHGVERTPLSSHALRRGLCLQRERSLSLVKMIATVSGWARARARARIRARVRLRLRLRLRVRARRTRVLRLAWMILRRGGDVDPVG
eukprot:scaffold138552_cov48-Phaeocystis_antarctica.AAC.1